MTDAALIPPDHVIVIFGGNGDLARKKLLPALWHLEQDGLMPERWRCIGNARSDFSTEEFRSFAREAVGEEELDEHAWDDFAAKLSFSSGEFSVDEVDVLAVPVRDAEADMTDAGGDGQAHRLFYLSTPPATFGPLTKALGKAGLAEGARVVYEKPFGLDHDSFVELDETVHEVLDERQVFRIDHFLGKEAVQNIFALRFANGMFEATWNRAHIDHVQIDVPEDMGIGTRAGFYEKTGALRDMLVTHLFQVLALVAMEPPTSLESEALVAEKEKVFESMRPLTPEDVVLGQYEGYREVDGVADDSQVDTFVAARVWIDNWRWDGVPFYLRTGKEMAEKRQTVTLSFRPPPSGMFRAVSGGRRIPSDRLRLELSGDEGATLRFNAKEPGPAIAIGRASMRFRYAESFGSEQIEAYERLIHDALLGDRTLYTRADGIGRTWELVEPIVDDPPAVHPYARGSWGPEAADDLVAPHVWHLPD